MRDAEFGGDEIFDWYRPEGPRGLYAALQDVLGEVDAAYVREFGAPTSWERATGDYDPEPHVVVIDDYSSEPWEDGDGSWYESPRGKATRAYKRECGWDFVPDPSGVWVCALVPSGGTGAIDPDDPEPAPWSYRGDLAAFVILHDRDEDGEPESVAHMWTARQARRQGLASLLLRAARSRYNVRELERPYTKDGSAFLAARW
jgi:hypothetical protein